MGGKFTINPHGWCELHPQDRETPHQNWFSTEESTSFCQLVLGHVFLEFSTPPLGDFFLQTFVVPNVGNLSCCRDFQHEILTSYEKKHFLFPKQETLSKKTSNFKDRNFGAGKTYSSQLASIVEEKIGIAWECLGNPYFWMPSRGANQVPSHWVCWSETIPFSLTQRCPKASCGPSADWALVPWRRWLCAFRTSGWLGGWSSPSMLTQD